MIYCLDANIFVQGWTKYYSPNFCKGYWEVLDNLAQKQVIFATKKVKDEIEKKEDDLNEWIKTRGYFFRDIDSEVTKCLRLIYNKDKKHERLVDSLKGRSEADPWVIAHAMALNAVVVTKEEKNTNPNSDKIKIPNVCENMGIRCINDFEFIKDVNIQFQCFIK